MRVATAWAQESRPPRLEKPATSETAEDGGFVVGGLAGEEFLLRVEADGYAPFSETRIPAGASMTTGPSFRSRSLMA